MSSTPVNTGMTDVAALRVIDRKSLNLNIRHPLTTYEPKHGVSDGPAG